MGNQLTPEQRTLVEEHLGRQENVVKGLSRIIEQQSHVLETIADARDEYDSKEEEDISDGQSGGDEVDILERIALQAENKQPEPAIDAAEQQAADEVYQEPTEDEERAFQATKPWLGAMAPPSNWRKDPAWDEVPAKEAELQYVYGYRARLCRSNIRWVDDSRIVYHAAAVGIVHRLDNNQQTFFGGKAPREGGPAFQYGHDDDIISLDFHAGRKIVATGQQGRTPPICVWNPDDPTTALAVLVGFHKRAVVAVAFSGDGSKVASVGLDDQHSVAVYSWQDGTLLSTSKGDTAKIINICYNWTKNADPNNDFVTVGSKHIKFWTQAGGRLKAKKGLLGKKGKRQMMVSLACTPDYMVVGCQDGSIYRFKNNKLKKVEAAHAGFVYTMMAAEVDGTLQIFSGGKDGALRRWDSDMEKLSHLDMNKHHPLPTPSRNSVRAVDVHPSGKKVIVGTITSEIYCITLGDRPEVTKVMEAHFGDMKTKGTYGELWGLTPTPGMQRFATCGEDATLRIWDVPSRRMATYIQLPVQARECQFSPDGKFIAVGYTSGAFGVWTHDGVAWVEENRIKKRKRRICDIKWSPDGNWLAIGSADNYVDLYSVEKDFLRVGVCKGNSSVILHLDFSKDSSYIQTNSQAYELLFYEIPSGQQYTRSRNLKDTQWATQSCTLGWNVQGIWPKFSDGSDVNSVARSNDERFLATAEDSGLVKVFNYPCVGSGLDRRGKLNRRPKCVKLAGHSSHVTNVNWLADDSYILSTGGADLCVMQWKVV